jgi:glycosyltransferase involved in cell wall biosynthesis
MITYNHEPYIKEAIESVLAQEIPFPVELVIGVDKGSDKTADIIHYYERQYPDIIKPRYYDKNIGMMANMIETLNRCKGKYIALLEGDDYWTYKNKLQEQIDFLEKNNEASFCFHNASVIYENSSRKKEPFANIEERFYSGSEIIKNWIVPTASVVFRNRKINFPAFAMQCAHGDILLFLLLLEYGKAYALTTTWCVYRKNSDSITNSNNINTAYLKKVIQQNKKTNIFFKKKYHKVLLSQRKYWELALITALRKNRRYVRMILNIFVFTIKSPDHVVKKFIY